MLGVGGGGVRKLRMRRQNFSVVSRMKLGSENSSREVGKKRLNAKRGK